MSVTQAFNSPTVKGGHVDHILTNLSVAYMQESDLFVARQIFPVVSVANASDLYFEYPRGYFWQDQLAPRPISGQPRQVGYKIVTRRYSIEEYALEVALDDRERANATQPHNPERSKVMLLTQSAMIHRDNQWQSSYFRSGVWSTDLTGVTGTPSTGQYKRFDEADSDPIAIIDEQREIIAEKTALEPNVLVLGRRVYRALKNHPDIRDRYKYTQGGQLTRDILASIFEVDRVIIPGGVMVDEAEQVDPEEYISPDSSFIFNSRNALLVYAAPNPSLDTPSGGYIFSWTGLLGDSALESGIWRGRDDRAYSDWFHIRVAYDMKMIGPDLGVFLEDAVS